MSTPASFDQYTKLHNVLNRPSSKSFQNFLANGDLLLQMACVDLSKVDRSAFKAVLTPVPASIAWRPVDEYYYKIIEWNELRGWGFTRPQISRFAATLVDHLDPLHPTGISLWLGRDLPYNWEEVTACLKHEVEVLGKRFTQCVESDRVSFFPGSEQSGKRKLTVALLDLQTYWKPPEGVVPSKVRRIEKRLPGLEVAWLLALNAPVYLAIGYVTTPGLIAAGLVVNSGSVPNFARDSDEAYVDDRWADDRWSDYSVVRFRE